MLTYTTLLIASLIVALVGLWIYKLVTDSSGSVYKSKPSECEIIDPADRPKSKPAPKAVADASAPWGQKGHQTPGNLAKTHAALPSGEAWWDTPENSHQVREPQVQSGTGDNAKHCSLYEASAEEPENKPEQTVGWPYREEKSESGGAAYKVTRRAKPKKTNFKTASKPWGW